MERLAKKLINWASILEPNTREQALRTASMPFIWPHLALMSDAHLGKGSTVGSVIPTLGAIMPAAVGVDIGCGMIATRTDLVHDDLRAKPLARLREAIAPNWRMQLGSLGSGNHFIEVSLDERDRVWLFLHSGSRGVGNKLATQHIKMARAWCERAWIQLPDPDLAYLVEGTAEFWAYLRDLRWAQHFALLNREEMMARVAQCLADFMGQDVPVEETIQCHHNYTEQMSGDLMAYWKSRPAGRSGHVWLSRKGAIDASPGKPGLIPGSMGTASYVVTGKGNKLSLNSSPHGAGREYSRSAARRTFTRAQLEAAMQGIEWRHTDAFLDEIPGAYKPVEQIMADAADLVEIRHTLRQIVNVKGD